MDVLLIQFGAPGTDEPLCRFDNSLGIAAAIMRKEQFTPHLLTLCGHQDQRLRKAITSYRPRHVVVDIEPHSVIAARRTIGLLSRMYALPVVAVGRYATCLPERALSIPGTQAVIVGEYERALCQYLLSVRDQQDLTSLPGVWVNTEDGLVHGDLPELLPDLDSLPFAERELFKYDKIVRATGELHFKACRGCPHWCAYCVNDWYMDIHAERGPFVRRRSVGHLLEEISVVAKKYTQAQRVVFYDHAFIDDSAWLTAFAAEYGKVCALPFHCHVRLNDLDAERASLLALAGCQGVTAAFMSGSNFIRDEVFNLNTDDAHIDLGFQLLRKAGLAITAEVLIGSPYESEITVEETIRRLRELGPDDIAVRVFHPTPGTRSAEMCHENSWVSGRSEEHYWQQSSTLDMPSLPAERINQLASGLPNAVAQPRSSGFMQVLARIRLARRRSLSGIIDKKKRPTA